MKATARREGGSTLRHTVQVREHLLTVDEPPESGGEDTGPDPQELLAVSLASCTAITMEMYAARKGWDIGHVEVDAQYTPAERGCPTKFELVLRLPDDMPDRRYYFPVPRGFEIRIAEAMQRRRAQDDHAENRQEKNQ